MATLTQKRSNLLRTALRANGIFSALSGILLALGASQFPSLMGVGTSLFYSVLGIILLFHAGMLFFFTRTETIRPAFAWYAILGDVAWVLATVVILLSNNIGLSSTGNWILLIIGDIVLVFAIVQIIGVRRANA